ERDPRRRCGEAGAPPPLPCTAVSGRAPRLVGELPPTPNESTRGRSRSGKHPRPPRAGRRGRRRLVPARRLLATRQARQAAAACERAQLSAPPILGVVERSELS